MQAVLWSPNLHNAISQMKKLRSQEVVSLFKDGAFTSTWSLSATEKKAVENLFDKKSNAVVKTQVTVAEFWE
jgi:hypothetical protein